jgi:hypothetical protein
LADPECGSLLPLIEIEAGAAASCRTPDRHDNHHTPARRPSRSASLQPFENASAMGDRRLTTFIAMTLLAVVAFAPRSLGSGNGATCSTAVLTCCAPPSGMVRQATNAAPATLAPLLAPDSYAALVRLAR